MATVMLFAIHPWVVAASGMVMTEATFTALTLLSLILVWRYEAAGNAISPWVVALGLALVSSIAVRTIGWSVLIAALIYLGVARRQVRQAVFLLVATIIYYLPLLLLNLQRGGGLISAGYFSQTTGTAGPAEKVIQVFSNLETYLGELFPLFMVPIPRLGMGIPLVVSACLVLLMLVGLRALPDRGRLVPIYLAIYGLGVLMFWNPVTGSAQTRFLGPILPLLVLLIVLGSERILCYLGDQLPFPGRSSSRVLAVTFVMLGILYLARDLQAIANPIKDRMTDISVGAEWIASNTPAHALMATQDPVPRHLYIGRKAIGYPDSSQPDFTSTMLGQGANYLIIAPRLAPVRTNQLDEQGERAHHATQENPERFRRVFFDNVSNVAVYEVLGVEAMLHTEQATD
jgi:hypothetical protein